MGKTIYCAVAAALLICGGLSSALAGQPVQHIVLVWLKPDVSADVRENIMRESQALAKIERIKALHVGKAIASERPIVDDSFDFGVYMNFASVEDMNIYLADPRHVQFVETVVKPHLQKLLVYDF
jgi:hypothetical protein